MKRITAQRAAVMEILGHGKFSVSGRTVVFTGNDGKTAIWGCKSNQDATTQMNAWRRCFSRVVELDGQP